MSSTTVQAGTSAAAEKSFLHLKGVNMSFTPPRPGYAIFIRIQVDDKTYESEPFGKGATVAWRHDIYVSSASSVSITCRRKQTLTKKIHERKPYAEVTIDLKSVRIDDGSEHSCQDGRPRISVELEFGKSIEYKEALKLLGEGVSSALAGKVILLDKLGKISTFVKAIIDFGSPFAELNDVAKVVFGVADVVFKKLEKQRECHGAAVDLVEFVLDKLPITEIIPEKMQNDLISKSLEKVLKITKEALDILHNYAKGFTFDTDLGKIRDLEKKLTDVSANLALILTSQSFVAVEEIKERVQSMQTLAQENNGQQKLDMLRKFEPAAAARDSKVPGCLKDTRVEVLGDITNWSEERSPSSKLYWLHGFAGSGKSSIAASVCEEFESKDMLAGSFYCKRDVPEQREPGRILPSLSNTLTRICKPYGECIVKALAKDPDIASRQINYQLTKLFREPFSELRQQEYSFERPIVFVVDALDECGTDDSTRSQIAECLIQLAGLADWLKVFVTSRPLLELERKFCPSPLPSPPPANRCINLNDQDSANDIMKYAKSQLQELVDSQTLDQKWLKEDAIKVLSRRASGLFIWMSTVMGFVRTQLDQGAALEKIMAGQDANPGSNLDTLYLAVVRSSRGGSDDANLSLMKAVLGIIHITAKNKPLSVDGLADLMPMSVSKFTLKAILNDLRSVLYEDGTKGNVIRVCHPSFLDFLESHARCGDYWTNPDELNGMMIVKCLMLMKTKLRFNICELESSGVANKDVPNLEQTIREQIPESLQYGSLYWITHITEANRSTVDGLVGDFFGSLQVLYWVEVLSLIGGLRNGLDILQAIDGIYKNEIARDTYKLLSSCYDAISLSTLHLYVSALTWLPDESELKRQFYGRFSHQPLISSGRNKRWHPALWLNSMGDVVDQVAFSPDGRYVAACSRDESICIWETKTGLLAMKLTGHSDPVYTLSYSPDGRQLVSGSNDCTLCVWDISTGAAVGEPLIGHTNSVTSVCYSPDGRYITSRSLDKTVKNWDSLSRSEVRTMDGLSEDGHVVYSLDGRRLACCGLEGIIVRDAQSGDLVGELQSRDVWSVAYSPDGRFLASGGEDGIVRLWDRETLAELAVLKGHSGRILSVAFSPDSSQLLSASSELTMTTWNVASKEMIGSPLRAHGAAISSAAYSPDGSYIASGSFDKTVRVWNTRAISDAESPTTKSIFSISLSPSGEEFASAGQGGDIRIRDVNTGAMLCTLTGHTSSVWAIAYSPSGKLLASGSNDRSVRLWDIATGNELHRFEGHARAISSIVFAPNEKHVISASFDGTVRRWQTDSSNDQGELLVSLSSKVRAVCISPTGEILASGGEDKTIRFSDLENGSVVGQQCMSTGTIYCLAFSPDGEYVASGNNADLIQIWDLETYSEVRRLEGHTSCVTSLAFSLDGKLLLSSSQDTTMRLWDSQTGDELCTLNGHTAIVIGAVFTNDGRRIISASCDGTCRIWSSSFPQIGPNCVPEAYRETLSRPLLDGWITTSTGELVLWVPSEYRDGIRDMSEVCVPADAPGHPIRLDWSKLVEGEEWTKILKVE